MNIAFDSTLPRSMSYDCASAKVCSSPNFNKHIAKSVLAVNKQMNPIHAIHCVIKFIFSNVMSLNLDIID